MALFGFGKSKAQVQKEYLDAEKKKAEAAPPAPKSDDLTSGAKSMRGMGSSAQEKADAASGATTAVKNKRGGAVKKYARGGGIEVRGKTRGKMC
jgi:hypothetical protein